MRLAPISYWDGAQSESVAPVNNNYFDPAVNNYSPYLPEDSCTNTYQGIGRFVIVVILRNTTITKCDFQL